MTTKAQERAKMPEGTSRILDQRNLQKDYPTLNPVIKAGMRVLDAGCGTGTITKGIAVLVGENGMVVGIDSSEHLIATGKKYFGNIKNLELIQIDLFDYTTTEMFDLIVSARVLQWLNNPKEALVKFRELLKSGGQISVLDYNHELLEWNPEPPASMKKFYRAFLDWRSDAGMDNEIADHMHQYFEELGFSAIQVLNSNEIYKRGDADFEEKVGIWSIAANTRGKQMVENGCISEEDRLKTIEDYNAWIKSDAELMIMKLKDTRGKLE